MYSSFVELGLLRLSDLDLLASVHRAENENAVFKAHLREWSILKTNSIRDCVGRSGRIKTIYDKLMPRGIVFQTRNDEHDIKEVSLKNSLRNSDSNKVEEKNEMLVQKCIVASWLSLTSIKSF